MADSLFVLGGGQLWADAANSLAQRGSAHATAGNAVAGAVANTAGSAATSSGKLIPAVAALTVAAGLVYTGYRYAAAKGEAARRRLNNRPRSPQAQLAAALAAAAAGHGAQPSPQRPTPPRTGPSSPYTPASATPGSPTTAECGRWIQGREIGRGSFGVVYEGTDAHSGTRVAIKEMRDVGMTNDTKKEFELLQGLRNPFVVAMYALEPDSRGGSKLIMELCTDGSLSEALVRNGPFSELRLRCYARQLLLGLQFLHHHNILHRDIKPANVLLDAQGRLKLTDFGLSRHLDSMRTRTTMAGSPAYMSPEAVAGRYQVGTDLWALGCTLSQLATGQVPWSHIRHRDLRNATAMAMFIGYGDKPGQPLSPNHHPIIPDFSDAAKDFFRTLFLIDVKARGTCDSLLQHPFITNGGPAITVDNYLGFLESSDSFAASRHLEAERLVPSEQSAGTDAPLPLSRAVTGTPSNDEFELQSAAVPMNDAAAAQAATPPMEGPTRPPTARGVTSDGGGISSS